MIFTSPRYSALAQAKLLQATRCSKMLVPSMGGLPIVNDIAHEHGSLRIIKIPSVWKLIDTPSRSFPYKKTFAEARTEPLMVLHTSGTTGFPKPIIWSHEWIAAYAAERYLDPPEGFESLDQKLATVRMLSCCRLQAQVFPFKDHRCQVRLLKSTTRHRACSAMSSSRSIALPASSFRP